MKKEVLWGLRIGSFCLFACFLLFWEFYDSIIPPPSEIFACFLELAKEGILQDAIIDSMQRFFMGLFIGGIVATFLGLILGQFAWIESIVEPFIQLFRPISPIAWLPIIVLLFGIGEVGAIFVIVYAVFFPVLILSITGVRNIDKNLIAMAKNFGASQWLIFLHITLPGAFRHIASGLKLAASIAWIHLVAGEMLGIQSGLGYLIIDGRNLLRLDMVIVAMILIGLLGYILHIFFSLLENLILKRLGN